MGNHCDEYPMFCTLWWSSIYLYYFIRSPNNIVLYYSFGIPSLDSPPTHTTY